MTRAGRQWVLSARWTWGARLGGRSEAKGRVRWAWRAGFLSVSSLAREERDWSEFRVALKLVRHWILPQMRLDLKVYYKVAWTLGKSDTSIAKPHSFFFFSSWVRVAARVYFARASAYLHPDIVLYLLPTKRNLDLWLWPIPWGHGGISDPISDWPSVLVSEDNLLWS